MSVYYYPFGGIAGTSTTLPQRGTVINVPSDMTPGNPGVLVTVPTPYPNAIQQVLTTISASTEQQSADMLTVQVGAKTAGTFRLFVTGGPPGSFVSIDYVAYGN